MIDFLSQYINLTWVYWFLTVAYAVTIISIVGVIVSENRNPVKSLAWVTVLLALPALGLLLYVVFGRNIKNKRIISRRNRRRLRRRESARKIDFARLPHGDSAKNLIRLAHSLSGAMYYRNNYATLYNNGRDKMDALINDIRQARDYINIQYYIINDDETGHRLKDALIERARAGVTVRVIYDHVGSFKVKNSFFKSMQAEGVQVYPFFKVTFPGLGSRINWRNHRKLCIIDGTVGYIGGMNIADRYVDGGKFNEWRDLHLRVTGPAVRSLQYSFAVDWNFMGQPLIDEEFSNSAPLLPPDGEQHTPTQARGMQLMTSGPTGQWSNISLMMLKAISQAKKCIFIQTPYFLPTDALLKALQTAALSRVDVRLMIPRRSDSDMLRWASYSYILECLQAGIKIYLYEPGMLHAKSMLIDDEISTVGSTNFDFRSIEHNFESNMFIYSHEFNARLRESFLHDQEQSHRVTSNEWRHRPIYQKALESFMRLFAPIL
ncbi:MAG: cardiolipin synthase [Bacteroides sp.]|nr:cardiolipin synthase [Bacteroides sp.]